MNVVSFVRSRRGTSGSGPASRALRAARSTAGSKRRRRPRSSMSASSTSPATSGVPRTRTTFACPPERDAGRTSTRSPIRAFASRSTIIRPPRSKNGSAVRKRPRLSRTATMPSPAPGSRRAGEGVRPGAADPPRAEPPPEEPSRAPPPRPPSEEPSRAPPRPPSEEPSRAPPRPPSEEPSRAPPRPPPEEPSRSGLERGFGRGAGPRLLRGPEPAGRWRLLTARARARTAPSAAPRRS